MKITHKLAALATAAVMMIAVTGCGETSFGKDDFFGTWVADYTLGQDEVPVTTSNPTGTKVASVMVFDGKSENLFNGGDGLFCQSKVRWTPSATVGTSTPAVVNFYWGTYKLKDNSNYTAGTIILTYMAGVNLTDKNNRTVTFGGTIYDLNDLMLITMGKKNTKDAEGNPTGLAKASAADGKEYKTGKEFFDAYIDEMSERNYYPADKLTEGTEAEKKKQAALRGDVEAFTFSLANGNLFEGYREINMHEWWWEDEIRFTNTQDDGKGTWSVANTVFGNSSQGLSSLSNGVSTQTSQGRTVKWYQPALNGTARGSAANKIHEDDTGAIVQGTTTIPYTAGTTKTWSKSYFSAGKSSWEVSDRSFARVTNSLDIDLAYQWILGEKDEEGNEITDRTGKTCDFKKNEMTADGYEPSTSEDEDDYSYYDRSVAGVEEPTFASEELINLVGERMEK